VLTGQDASQIASQTEVVAIKTDRYDRMTVPVRFGEHGPFDFLIDTGAQNTVLSKGLAAKLAFTPGRRAKLIGVAGSEIVDTVEIDQIDLGRRSFYGLRAPLLDSHNMGAEGILGLDSLQNQRLLFDFRKRIVAINDAKALGGNRGFEIVVTARRRSGQLILTEATLDGVRLDVVIDTGAETSIGNRALQRAMTRRRGLAEQTVLKSVTGQEIVADIGYGKKLAIDRISFQNVMIAYTDAPPFAALDLNRRPALLLGMRDLRGLDRMAIDFSTRRILFDMPDGIL
jgi:predicted aspartyl protease